MKQEESFANNISYNGLISKIYKELNPVAKTIDNLILKFVFVVCVFFFSQRRHTRGQQAHEKMCNITNHQFSSVQSLSHARLFATPWTTACQASLFITNFQSPPKPMSIESVMPSNHLILSHPLLLLPSIFPSIRVSSNVSALHIRWYWSLSFNISPFNEHPGLISFRMDWLAIIREIQIKTTISYCFTLTKMAVIKRQEMTSAGESEKKGNTHTLLLGM